jgi:hypothetical protein
MSDFRFENYVWLLGKLGWHLHNRDETAFVVTWYTIHTKIDNRF